MLDEIKKRLEAINQGLKELRGYFDIDNKVSRIEQLSKQMSEQDFWNNEIKAQQVVRELKNLKSVVEPWQSAQRRYQEIAELVSIATAEEQSFLEELQKASSALEKELNQLESKTLLDNKNDPNNALLAINAGAGGTESCDWVQMLLRMYSRWAEEKGFAVKIVDMLPGEEAGIKNVTLFIEGAYAYGYLQSERGVHRLVRISPFDANRRRHTSFASVDVIPELEDNTEVVIEEKDLIIETFRASTAGGQHMQKTDSAVRITHIPTGIVVQSQNERSQYQNKQTALRVLKARIYELKEKQRQKELEEIRGKEKKKIEWGSQIRSYVLYPYTLVKDHRTGYQTANADAVLDGDIDGFIEEYLKYLKGKKLKKTEQTDDFLDKEFKS
ncbi:MAG: peptide chain release factor 2 [Candidatus Omnitrophica bacterium]|nr:peptide chain release factor 2 [Candidatus Omnitrophota bacterium]